MKKNNGKVVCEYRGRRVVISSEIFEELIRGGLDGNMDEGRFSDAVKKAVAAGVVAGSVMFGTAGTATADSGSDAPKSCFAKKGNMDHRQCLVDSVEQKYGTLFISDKGDSIVGSIDVSFGLMKQYASTFNLSLEEAVQSIVDTSNYSEKGYKVRKVVEREGKPGRTYILFDGEGRGETEKETEKEKTDSSKEKDVLKGIKTSSVKNTGGADFVLTSLKFPDFRRTAKDLGISEIELAQRLIDSRGIERKVKDVHPDRSLIRRAQITLE